MKFRWYKQVSALLAIALLISVVPVYSVTAAASEKLATTIHFVNKDNVKELSAANGYINNPYIINEEDKTYLELEIDNIMELVVTIEGSTGTTVEDKGTTIVKKYEVSDITEPFTASTSYRIPGSSNASSHNVTVVVGNDIDETKTELESAINTAKQLTDATEELTEAIQAAEEANTFITKLTVMQGALAALKTAIEEHGEEEPTPTPEPVDQTEVKLSYVDVDKITSYDAHFTNLVAKTNVVTEGRNTFLRIKSTKSYSLVITVNGSAGELIDDTDPAYNVFQYQIPSRTAAIPATVSYTAGPRSNTFNMLIIIDQDATAEDRATLTAKIEEADAVVAKGAILIQALAAAEADNNLVSRKAVLVGHTNALEAALATNSAIE